MPMKAVMIGAGNAAFHLAPALQVCGLEWVQVYNRTLSKAQALACRLKNARAVCRPEEITDRAEVYFFALSDEALPEWASRLRFSGKTAVHVAGSVPLSVFGNHWAHGGVMYFFQTFSRLTPSPDFKHTPVCIEASDTDTLKLLEDWAGKLSDTVVAMNSAQRKALHLGGVFASNYANFMYTAAYDILREQNLDFSLLWPLIGQTVRKIRRFPPHEVQTGPAIRGDEAVLEQQARYLAESSVGKEYLEIYRLLATKIRERGKSRSR